MPTHITAPSRPPAAGNSPKVIEEYVGRMNTGSEQVSIAHMHSPGGWQEPGQAPEFDEYTLVLAGTLHVEHADGSFDVTVGQAVHARKGEWVRYSTLGADGAEYVAICTPAFSPHTVHRDDRAPNHST